ncbi:MAG: hypothetical protein WC571_04010 [Candidatus Omnitrophota bacterium]
MKKIISLLFFISLPLMAYAQHEHMLRTPMYSFYGPYPGSREASGTSWQPESSPMEGRHFTYHDWNVMIHGYVFGIYDHQGGKRGHDKGLSTSMFMLMADRKLSLGTIGYRSMYSLDPLMGKRGYPLLFQTGETYDGIHPLIDRQHPHDFFMEEALTYSLPLSGKSSLFGYFGLPGEPALGPPAFMHRFSAMDNPEAPLGHHWLDSTHITFGVATLGYVFDKFKVEGSAFRGREPNENRWDMESPKFDSYSTRITFNPDKDLSFQVSYGYLDSPEQLEPNVDARRATFSAIYNRNFVNGNWQTTFAWGRNNKDPGLATDAFLIESAINFNKSHTIFSRFEYVEKDELFEEGDPLAGKSYDVKKLSLGYVYDFLNFKGIDAGIGASFDLHFIPDTLQEAYSNNPRSFMVFMRVKL